MLFQGSDVVPVSGSESLRLELPQSFGHRQRPALVDNQIRSHGENTHHQVLVQKHKKHTKTL